MYSENEPSVSVWKPREALTFRLPGWETERLTEDLPSVSEFKTDLLAIAENEEPPEAVNQLLIHAVDVREQYEDVVDELLEEKKGLEHEQKVSERVWKGEMQALTEQLIELHDAVQEVAASGGAWHEVLAGYVSFGYVIDREADPVGIQERLGKVVTREKLLQLLLEVTAHYMAMMQTRVVHLRDNGVDTSEEE